MQPAILFQSFNRGDLLTGNSPHWHDARTRRQAVDQNSASTAFTFATTVLAASQVEIVAQYAEQTRRRVNVDLQLFAVDIERGNLRHIGSLAFLICRSEVAVYISGDGMRNLKGNDEATQTQRTRRSVAKERRAESLFCDLCANLRDLCV